MCDKNGISIQLKWRLNLLPAALSSSAEYGGYVTLAVMLAFFVVFVLVGRSIKRFNKAISDHRVPPAELPMVGSSALRDRYRQMSNDQKLHFWGRYRFVGRFMLLPIMIATIVVWLLLGDLPLTVVLGLVLLVLLYFAHSGGR